jgi:hypothetical protein
MAGVPGCSGADGRCTAGRVEGLELFETEDEVYEAEALFAGPKFRSYVKAQAQCRQGSVLIIFVGPGDSGDLPSVGG